MLRTKSDIKVKNKNQGLIKDNVINFLGIQSKLDRLRFTQRQIIRQRQIQNIKEKHKIKSSRNHTIQSKQTQQKVSLIKTSSFLLKNRLTQSNYKITDTVFVKPQPFKSTITKSHPLIPSLKYTISKITTNIHNISMKSPPKSLSKTKSFIPKRYQKVYQNQITLINQKNERNHNSSILSIKSQYKYKNTNGFFHTGVEEKSKIMMNDKNENHNKLNIIKNKQKFKQLQKSLFKQKTQTLFSNHVTRSARSNISRIDFKIKQLKVHENLINKLMPIVKVKEPPIVIKGKGQIVSTDKIQNLLKKIIKIMQMYFNTFQTIQRTTQILRHVQGFENEKVKQLLMDNNTHLIKRIKNVDELKHYFWAFKRQNLSTLNLNKQQNNLIELPEFFGQQDNLIFRSLNFFMLKLQHKYDHILQTFRKNQQIQVEKQDFQVLTDNRYFSQFEQVKNNNQRTNNYQSSKAQTNVNVNKLNQKKFPYFLKIQKSFDKSDNLQQKNTKDDNAVLNKKTSQSQISKHSRSSKSELLANSSSQISSVCNPQLIMNRISGVYNKNLLNTQKLSMNIQNLQSLGVNFNFEEKGKNLILNERLKIFYGSLNKMRNKIVSNV